MLIVSGTRGEQMPLVAGLAAPPTNLYPITFDVNWRHLDPARMFLFPCIFNRKEYPVLGSLGYGTSDDTLEVQVTGERPVQEWYSDSWDRFRMGRGLDPIFPARSLPGVRAERPVFHSSWKGKASCTADTDVENYFTGTVETIDQWGITRPDRYYSLYQYSGLQYISGTWMHTIVERIQSLRHPFDLHALFTEVDSQECFIRDSYPGLPRATVGSWSLFHQDLPYRGFFKGEFRSYVFSESPSPSNKRYWKLPFEIDLSINTMDVSNGSFPYENDHYDYSPFTVGSMVYSFGAPSNNGSPYSAGTVFNELMNTSFTVNWVSPFVACTRPLEPGSLIRNVDDGFSTLYRIKDIGSQRDRFSSAIEHDVGNVAPGFFYSASDAILKHIDVLQANNLENLTQLSSMGDIIPDVAQFIKLISQVRNGRWIEAGLNLVDAWSEAQLKWSYGAKPTISDVTELQSRIEQLKAALTTQGLYGHTVLHGSHKLTLYEGRWDRDIVHLDYRSKVDITFGYSSLLSTLLRGREIGLFSGLSTLWDLVPFSFVFDWKFNISERLGDIDAQAFMLMFPVKSCTHSLTASSPLSPSEMENMGIIPVEDPEEVPSVWYYRRILSLYLPHLRDSQIDFRPPSGIPLLTAGALAIQLMK